MVSLYNSGEVRSFSEVWCSEETNKENKMEGRDFSLWEAAFGKDLHSGILQMPGNQLRKNHFFSQRPQTTETKRLRDPETNPTTGMWGPEADLIAQAKPPLFLQSSQDVWSRFSLPQEQAATLLHIFRITLDVIQRGRNIFLHAYSSEVVRFRKANAAVRSKQCEQESR